MDNVCSQPADGHVCSQSADDHVSLRLADELLIELDLDIVLVNIFLPRSSGDVCHFVEYFVSTSFDTSLSVNILTQLFLDKFDSG